MRRSFRRTVFWESLIWIDTNHAPSNDNLPAFAVRIMAHKVSRQSCTVHCPFEVGVRTRGIWLRRKIFNWCVSSVEIVYRALIGYAGVRDQDVNTIPFLPDFLEKLGL